MHVTDFEAISKYIDACAERIAVCQRVSECELFGQTFIRSAGGMFLTFPKPWDSMVMAVYIFLCKLYVRAVECQITAPNVIQKKKIMNCTPIHLQCSIHRHVCLLEIFIVEI